MTSDGLGHTIRICVEVPVTFRVAREKLGQKSNLVKGSGINRGSHMESAEEGDNINLRTHGKAIKRKGPFMGCSGADRKSHRSGP